MILIFVLATLLPNGLITQGSVYHTDAQVVCRPGYAKAIHENISKEGRQIVLKRYQIKSWEKVTIDHLIDNRLGGSNNFDNLWPQSTGPFMGSKHKDALVVLMRSLVCSGQLDLVTAQTEIRTNWVAAYHKYIK